MATRRIWAPALTSAVTISAVGLSQKPHRCDGPAPERSRKPIYDDLAVVRNPPPKQPITQTPTSPTPTDRLASQIRRARLFLHHNVVYSEDRLNAFMSSLLAHEHSFTSTVASLAPPRESKERLMPGAIYVLVATMAGSIISRNRNILLRATVPVAVGLGVAWTVLPVTMGNVSDLTWKYEQKSPFVAENHLRVREAVIKALEEAKRSSVGVRRWTEESVKGGRQALEDMVKKST